MIEQIAPRHGDRISTDLCLAPIEIESISAKLKSDESGAFVTFRGDVRNHDLGRIVTKLEYEAHPTAAAHLAQIAHEIFSEKKINGIAIHHRYGSLAIGDCALFVATTSAHREDAFHACARAVDLVKERIPIWKHQFFADGTDEWVNSA